MFQLDINQQQHERNAQFAKCVAHGHSPYICAFGVGFPRDRAVAQRLTEMPLIKKLIKEYEDEDASTSK